MTRNIDVIFKEDVMYFIGRKLLMRMVGNALDVITEDLAHLGRENERVFGFEQITDTTLARLGVDADNVCFVNSADVGRVDGKIRHVPDAVSVCLAVVHTLGDGILMRAAECRKDERAAIRLTFIDVHTRYLFIGRADFGEIRKIKLGVNALRIHIERKRDDIYVARTFAVSEKCSLDAVAACEKSHFAIRNGASAVIVRMERNDQILSVMEMLAHIFDLICINVRHGMGNRYGQIDDDLVVFVRLPDIDDLVTNFRRKFGFCTRKAFGRIFKGEMSLCFCAIFLAELRTEFCNFDDLFLGFFEHLLALCDRGGVIKMHDRVLCAAERFKGLGDDMFTGLCQHLNRYVIGNHIVFDQCTAKFIFRFACRRETDLDLLKADLDEQLKKFQFFFKAHRHDKRLVAISEVNAAPDRRFFKICFFHPIRRYVFRGEKLLRIFLITVHILFPFRVH